MAVYACINISIVVVIRHNLQWNVCKCTYNRYTFIYRIPLGEGIELWKVSHVLLGALQLASVYLLQRLETQAFEKSEIQEFEESKNTRI